MRPGRAAARCLPFLRHSAPRLIAWAGRGDYPDDRGAGRRRAGRSASATPRGSRGDFTAMQDDVSRRSFLRACGAAGATVAVGEAAPGLAAPPVAAAPSWVDRPMRWAQLTLVEDDPGQFDLPFWLDYFRRTHSRRGLPQRRRLRRLLSHQGPLPPPQPVPGRPRPVRRAGRRLPEARHGRDRADRPARDLRRRPARRIPTGSPSTPRASRAGTGPRPRCGSPAPWARTTSSS